MNLDPKKKLIGSYWNFSRSFFAIVSSVFFIVSIAIGAVPDEEQQIRTAFSNLQKAFNAKDGNAALALLSSDTKDYYRVISGVASSNLTLEKLQAQHLSALNLFMIKHVKRTLPKDFWKDYKKTNPDKLLKYAVDKGLGAKELTDNIRLGVVRVEGDIAEGKLIKGAQPLPLRLMFLKEAGQWKVSLLSMFEQANKATEAFLKKSGMKIEDLEKLVLQ